MRSLAERVRRTIRTHGLAAQGHRVLAAVSGGCDSIALVHLLRTLDRDGTLRLVGVAHFNHQLRAEAPGDEAFVREVAAGLDLPVDVESANVAELAAEQGVSVEVAARDVRYAFLERAAVRARADRVAVGHTLDDQAETFLLRLLRGAGARGLAAIRPRAGRIIRPLIEVGRDELRAYLVEHGLSHREDETNRDLANPRNRIRHELLPYLRRSLAPNVTTVLAREAAIARDDADWLEAAAIEIEPTIVLVNGDVSRLDVAGLLAVHPALARRLIHRLLTRHAAGRFIGFDHVEAVLGLASAGGRSAGIDLPGQRAELSGGCIRLAPAGAVRASTAGLESAVILPVPGTLQLPAIGWVIAADVSGVQYVGGPPDALSVTVDRGAVAEPLAIRTRRPGDWLRPLGLGGRKKLQDLLVDRKVPRAGRDHVPIVVDGRDRIVWVVGHALAEDFRVTDPSSAVILLKASRLGG